MLDTVNSPNCLCTFSKINWQVCFLLVCFWVLCFDLPISMSCICQCHIILIYCSFVNSLKIGECAFSNFILFQNCPGYKLHINFGIIFSISTKRACWDSDWNDVKFTNQCEENWYLSYFETSSPQTQYISPFMWVIF